MNYDNRRKGWNAYSLTNLYKRLENNFFFVYIPTIAKYSDEEIRLLGVHSSLYKKGKVNRLSSSYTFDRVRLPISRMVEIYNSGFPIKVPKDEDLFKITEAIDEVITLYKQGHAIDKTGTIANLENFIKEILEMNEKTIDKKLNEESTDITATFFGNGIFNNDYRPNFKDTSKYTIKTGDSDEKD